MKMKKVLAVALAAAMVMTAGCGGNGKEEKKADSDKIRIGAIGPTTGGAAIYGEAVKNGAELAIKEINEAGGINGVLVKFNFQD